MAEKKWKKRAVTLQEANEILARELAEERAQRSVMVRMLEQMISQPKEIVAAFADVVNPRQTGTTVDDLMRTLNDIDDGGGKVEHGVIPQVEFDDEWMDSSQKDKVAGEWTAKDTMNGRPMVTVNLPDPTINPHDGTPRFRAGSSGPPPVGGME